MFIRRFVFLSACKVEAVLSSSSLVYQLDTARCRLVDVSNSFVGETFACTHQIERMSVESLENNSVLSHECAAVSKVSFAVNHC